MNVAAGGAGDQSGGEGGGGGGNWLRELVAPLSASIISQYRSEVGQKMDHRRLGKLGFNEQKLGRGGLGSDMTGWVSGI